jgi:hypothetical protein
MAPFRLKPARDVMFSNGAAPTRGFEKRLGKSQTVLRQGRLPLRFIPNSL